MPLFHRATLVLFAHPHCPCTRASVSELARLMRRVEGRVAVQAVFLQPDGYGDAWTRSDLWRSAVAIPGVDVRRDAMGMEARRFGAHTSGQLLLHDAGGALRFKGGITASRGHEGDNAGRTALTDLLTTGGTEHTETFVFGCSLDDPRRRLHRRPLHVLTPHPTISRSTTHGMNEPTPHAPSPDAPATLTRPPPCRAPKRSSERFSR